MMIDTRRRIDTTEMTNQMKELWTDRRRNPKIDGRGREVTRDPAASMIAKYWWLRKAPKAGRTLIQNLDPAAHHPAIVNRRRDEGIDQLNFHSAQLGYLKLLQMGTQTQKDKAGNKYEVKPQYEELSKQLYLQNILSAGREKTLKTTTHPLNQTTPLLNAFAQARLLISSNHHNATISSKEYVTLTSTKLSTAFATSFSNHQLITVPKRLC
ncbi:hypothetical protein F511_37405 [Dorcoceras hygrometricum]|uniref:Uncharacterized protein n=1 Tax=Dorcoceras hygrometricum TaxID=472368 RepID=A0A2Z7B0P7_9LAMI|nr:hypothetical protein F511_37405 [Dorcoceras hygrometricum]